MKDLAIGALLMALLMQFMGTGVALAVMIPVSIAWGFLMEPYLESRRRSTTV